MAYVVSAKWRAKPGKEQRLEEIIRELAEPSRAEPGNLFYQAHRSPDNPRLFYLYEQYDDQAALDAHRAAPHFEQYAKGGLFPIIESRSPELYVPLTD